MKTTRQRIGTLALFAIALAGALGMASEAYCQTAFECKPTAYPVQNFKKAVDEVDASAKELSELFSGPEGAPLRGFLSNSQAVAELKFYLQPLPPVYSNKPVQAFLKEVWNNSTIFNWEGDNGTAATLGRVAADLRTRREQVMRRKDLRVAALNRMIEASKSVAHVFKSATGLLGKAKNETQSVQETYLKKAFDHLDACLTTCGGPGDFNLPAFRNRFDKLYGAASEKNFEANLNEVKAGGESADGLAADLENYRSLVARLGDLEAANLQKAADILYEARRNGSWYNVGSQNEKILRAITILDSGYSPSGKRPPSPDEIGKLVDSTYNQAARVRSFTDVFLAEHSRLVDDLKKFLGEYNKTYEPGCRATKR
jgi:hypothetical protein